MISRVRQRLFKSTLIGMFAICGLARSSEPPAFKPFQVQIEPEPGENFSYGVFECWLPPGGVRPKGVLCVILHPHDARGATLKEAQPWRDLAAKYDCALIGASFAACSDHGKPWGRAKLGTGRALLAALDRLSAAASLPELRASPLVLCGVCEAGQFAHEFASSVPQRVAAFVTIGGAKHNLELITEVVDIPALFVATPDRGKAAMENILRLFTEGRKRNAPWALTFEPISDYDSGKCGSATIEFIKAALQQLSSDPESPRLEVTQGTLTPISLRTPSIGKDVESTWFPTAQPDVTAQTSVDPAVSALSFRSEAVPESGTTSPCNISIGTVSFDDTVPVTFSVEINEGTEIAGIFTINDPQFRSVQINRIGERQWNVSGELNVAGVPSGAFRVEIPVRYIGGNGALFGGNSVVVSGSVFGDVRPTPASISIGRIVPGETAIVEVALKSASGTPIELVKVDCDSADVLTRAKKLEATKSLQVQLEITPHESENSDSFIGYLRFTIKSNEMRDLRILCYGSFRNNR